MAENLKADFCIEIDYKKDSENPSRVFEAMTALIKSFQSFDEDLIKSIDNKIEPVLLLEDIEIGSLKTWLANKLKGVPDEGLKDLSWKKIVGSYLVKAKHIVIKRLEGKTVLTDAKMIEYIQYELVEEAKKTDLKRFPSYAPVKMHTLVENINRINDSLKPLSKEDKALMKSDFGDASFNLELDITPESLEDLVTREKIVSDSVMILKVKQPDYLGQAMWTFKYSGRLVPAKIIHEEWLLKFQNREIDIRPGDSLRAKVTTTVKYGHDYEVIGHHYEIVEVLEVLQDDRNNQGRLEFDDSV
jgi:hypothetical protein